MFSVNGAGSGQGAILNARDESVNSPSNPATRGQWVSIFASGGGVTTPPSMDGFLASAPLPAPTAAVSVTIGGTPCQINYAGAAPGLVSGVLQVNAQVPAGLAPGPAVPVQIRVGNTISSPAITLAVQ